MIKRLLLVGVMCCCFGISSAQLDSCYEFTCDYFDKPYTCPIRWYGDTLLVVTHLFNEISISDKVSFTFQDSCVYLTVDGQKGVFWGNSDIGSWNATNVEDQRFTVKWDILNCTNDTIYRFVFIPYYQENNPYEESDGTKIFHYYFDMTYYYWARSVGVIAFEGESLYVRKDQEAYKQCLLDAIRSYR